MKWPWVRRERLENSDHGWRALAEAYQKAATEHADEVAGLKAALKIRTEEVGLLKGDVAILDQTETVDGLYVRKGAGETWREYNRRILQSFKDGADSTLFKAILDEVGRYERQAFLDCIAVKEPSLLMRGMGQVEMARTLKSRLLSLTGSIDKLTERERERQTRAQMAFSDTEDEILGREVLEGRIPKR